MGLAVPIGSATTDRFRRANRSGQEDISGPSDRAGGTDGSVLVSLGSAGAAHYKPTAMVVLVVRREDGGVWSMLQGVMTNELMTACAALSQGSPSP